MLKSLRALPVLALLCTALLASPVRAQVSLTTLGSASTQNFDGLANAGTNVAWADNSTIAGWYSTRTTYNAGTGSSNTGALYSFGVAGTNPVTDRALGGVGSGGTGTFFWAVRFVNNTGATITSLNISYTGEEWRDGGAVTPVAQTMVVQQQVANAGVITDADTPTTGWTTVPSLAFTSPTFTNTGAGAALDGNAAANRTVISFTLPVTVSVGQEVWIRWQDLNDAGNDHGLAIDNLSVTPQGGANAPVVPSCPASLATIFGTATSTGVSASDADGTVTSATITGITPSNPGTITLTGFTPAGGVGGTANATLNVSNTTPVGSYNVTIQWANNDASPQTATCAVAVSVTSITFIHDVQGNGAATPIPGSTVSVEGIVTADFQGTNISGFFLQEEDADADANPATSEGIFVFCGACPTPVAEGQRVQVTGVVSEFNLLTEITASTAPSVVVTNAGNNLAQVTPATIDLPIAGVVDDYYEAREGMKVTFVDTLTVSEYFELGRYGQIILYEGGRPRQFTEFSAPSVAGNAAWADTLSRRKVILDDDNNAQEWYLTTSSPPGPANGLQYVYYPRANGGFSVGTQGTDFFRGGDLVNGLTGVLHWSFAGQAGTDAWRIRPTAANPAAFTVANPRPATPPAVGGTIHVVGMNLLNYFTTIDTTLSTSTGPCSPSGTLDCRGADSVAELNRQRARAALVICTLNADIYGFAELENTTPSASITDLLGAVNASCGGAHPYAFVNTGGTLGTDAIRVQQIYRTGIVSPVGAPLSDPAAIHSRPPTAQTYDVVDAANPAFGQRFTVVINHFKSKGSSAGLPGDADTGDGAGASNATRTAQASQLLAWITGTVLPAAGDPDFLLLGDFNSYAKEDPINVLIAGGYTDLETLFHGANAYSYLFDGQLGHLDYGFANTTLLPQVTGADAWHINADEVDLFDYNDEIFDSPGEATFEEKPDGSALVPPRVVFQAGTPYRASDHDPVVVGLFASADLAITKTDGVTTVTAGGSTTYTITASNAGPSNATGATVADTFPASLTCNWTCVGAGGGTCTASGSGNINDIANLPAGGSVTYTASCTVSASATGTLSNTATVTAPGGVTDPTPGNNSATDSDTVVASADPAITKTDGVTTAIAGGSVTYTITASNAGPSNATGATVADTFPASLTCNWTCVGAGGGTCAASGSGNINGSVNLPAGGSVTYTATCALSASATGTLSNTATVTAPAGVTDPTPGNNSATDTDTVGLSSDLSITKTDGVTTATAGGSVTYTITASNAGPSNATGATVADTFPASLTCNWTCVGAGGGTCTASGSGNINGSVNLPAGGSVTYTASCTVSAAATGTIANTATVTAPGGVTDPTPGNNSATDTDTVGSSADLSITKTDGVTTATAGGSVTYTITASNAGPSNATGATVADTFPASLTCNWTCVGAGGGTCTASGSGNINGSVNLPAGGSVTYTASCTISASATGTLSNTATVTAPAGVTDPTPGNNSATDTDTVGSSADLSITKTDGVTTAIPGAAAIYTIVASNAGPSNATGATVTDTFPAPLTCAWTCVGAGGGTCTASGSGNLSDTVNLPVGGSVTYTASCTISAAATGTLPNTATVTAPGGVTDPNPANNSATDFDTLGASADLAITKTDGVTSVTAGGSVTYTITASNAGPSNATGATVADTFPASLTCNWTCTGAGGGTCAASGAGNINGTVNLPSGGSVTYTATCTVSALATGTLSNTATVTAPAGVTDPNPGNNAATDSDTLTPPTNFPVLSATKTVSSGPHPHGSTVTYTIVIHNTGTGAQADNPGNEFTDVLPAQLTLVSATATSGTATATVGTNTATWNGSIAAGGSVTVTITATVNFGVPSGSPVNNQGIISFDGDGNGSNESSAVTDNPGTGAPGDSTVFIVGPTSVVEVPTLDGLGLMLLAALLALGGAVLLRRRKAKA